MNENDVIDVSNSGLVRRAPREVVLMPVMDVKFAQHRLQELQEFCANYLEESTDGGTDGGDFGIIPGAGKKKVLFKSGADKLCDVYGLADRYTIISKVEEFEHGLFDYTIQCELVRKTDEMFVGSGLGSCSTYEAKYRWRESQRTCPACGSSAIIKGKAEFGGGWLCWAKKGGCGAKYAEHDPAIIGQTTGRVENPDIIDSKNTVLKMAKKRAKIDAVIGVTRSSGIFTQDLEEHELADEAKAVTPATPESTEPHGPAMAKATGPNPTETHAEKIARVKAEAAAKRAEQPPATTISTPAPVEPPPVPTTPTIESPKSTAPAPEGQVYITAINVRNGPMVMKDGKSQPAWGPLYIIAFSAKVKASDGAMTLDASTFNQKDAAIAEEARDKGQALKPVIEPGTKKGSFKLVKFADLDTADLPL